MLISIQHPWPWYIAGPLIGLIVPVLLLLGNKPFGVSSNLKHICAACFPANISFFKYDWKQEKWNLFFIGGVLVGAIIASVLIPNPDPVKVNPELVAELKTYGLTIYTQQLPPEIFSFASLFTLRGFILMIVGGFLVGFGTRYANGCTSGHSIMGLSNLQFSSFVATICFMAGGFLMANIILPFIMNL